jgi:hypothetical protein
MATVICRHHHYLFHSLSGAAFGGALPWPQTMATMNACVPVHHNNRAAAVACGLCRRKMPSIELPSLTSLRGRQTMTTLVTWPPSSCSMMEGRPPPRGGDADNVDGLRRRPPAAWQLALDIGLFDGSVRLAEESDGGCVWGRQSDASLMAGLAIKVDQQAGDPDRGRSGCRGGCLRHGAGQPRWQPPRSGKDGG